MNLIFLRKIRIRSCVNFRRKHILLDCLFTILCYFLLYSPPIHLIHYFFVSLPAFETKKPLLTIQVWQLLSHTRSLSVCLSVCLPLSPSHSTSQTHSHYNYHSLTCSIIPTHSLSSLSPLSLSLSLSLPISPLSLSLSVSLMPPPLPCPCFFIFLFKGSIQHDLLGSAAMA